MRSPAFTALWGRHEVGSRTTESKRFLHQDVGELVLHFESLVIASAPGQHLSVYSTEPGSPNAAALAALAAGHERSERGVRTTSSGNGDPTPDRRLGG